jgi:hypothetical protein
MTFDEWFTRKYGFRPSNESLAVIREDLRNAKARVAILEDVYTASRMWEAQYRASKLAWTLAKNEANK